MIDRLALALLEGWEKEDCPHYLKHGFDEDGYPQHSYCDEFKCGCDNLCEYSVLIMEEFAETLND